MKSENTRPAKNYLRLPALFSCNLLFIFLVTANAQSSKNQVSPGSNSATGRAVVKSEHKSFVSYVDPYIGSGGHGHVFVGASVPFGAIQLGPTNLYKGWDWSSGYYYADTILIGFAQTHLPGTGCADLGDVLLMPYTGAPKTLIDDNNKNPNSCTSSFSHKNEKVQPGYYSLLMDNGVAVELSATERVGIHKYTFPKGKEAHITINLQQGIGDESYDTYLKQKDAYTIEGYRFSKGWSPGHKVYFTLKTNYPVDELLVYQNDTLAGKNEIRGKGVKGVINFKQTPASIQLKVGISSVSCANALNNITSEAANWDFNQVVKDAQQKWEEELSKITIETKDETLKTIFYTSFYHTMIAPYLYSDENGDFRGHDDKVYRKNTWTNYSAFSLWDTYRCANSLFTILQPKLVNNIVNSMIGIYKQQGRLPIWPLAGGETNCMPGYSAVPVIADAYLKGFTGFDVNAAWNAVISSANYDKQVGVPFVKTIGFIPADSVAEATSVAMEYAVDDAAIAAMAKKMNKSAENKIFAKRGEYYKNYFDTSIGFVRPKLADGSWYTPYFPAKSVQGVGKFTEGNGWQYTFFAPQDPHGLIKLLKGDDLFSVKLDSFFTVAEDLGPDAPPDITGLIGQYAHGNEPSHHIAYLYTFAGKQWKTAEKVRYIMEEFYTDKPDGIIGNEDCGQMSAWYIMSSLGFYPVNPFNSVYVFGSPLFNKATISVAADKTFTVESVNNSKMNVYIQKVELNGRPYAKSFISYKEIMQGGVLKFFMGSQPNTSFGAGIAERP
jgi:predicted alpha-1,2-mannosidase